RHRPGGSPLAPPVAPHADHTGGAGGRARRGRDVRPGGGRRDRLPAPSRVLRRRRLLVPRLPAADRRRGAGDPARRPLTGTPTPRPPTSRTGRDERAAAAPTALKAAHRAPPVRRGRRRPPHSTMLTVRERQATDRRPQVTD